MFLPMTGPGDRARWNNEPTVPMHAVGGDLGSRPTVALPIVPPAQPELGTAPVVESESPPPPPEDVDDSTGSVARNSGAMAIGSLVSRATGFLRVAVIGAAAGGATVGDDYNLANNLPNMVYE